MKRTKKKRKVSWYAFDATSFFLLLFQNAPQTHTDPKHCNGGRRFKYNNNKKKILINSIVLLIVCALGTLCCSFFSFQTNVKVNIQIHNKMVKYSKHNNVQKNIKNKNK